MHREIRACCEKHNMAQRPGLVNDSAEKEIDRSSSERVSDVAPARPHSSPTRDMTYRISTISPSLSRVFLRVNPNHFWFLYGDSEVRLLNPGANRAWRRSTCTTVTKEYKKEHPLDQQVALSRLRGDLSGTDTGAFRREASEGW